jgi:ribose/xylose/arabinose/galactoside ABC-type transport system permease subunit
MSETGTPQGAAVAGADTAAAGPAPEPSYLTGLRTRMKDPSFWADWTVVPAFIVLVIVFGLLDDVFLTSNNIESVLAAAAVLMVLAIGQTFAVATAGIDLSMGSVLTLSGVVLGKLYSDGRSIWLAMLAAVLVGAGVGFLNGFVIAKAKITDFIVTLGSLSIAAGLALVISDGKPVQVIDKVMLDLSTNSVGPLRWVVIVALLVALGAHVLLFHTRFGTHLLATGGNVEGSRAVGVRTARVKMAAYTLSGAMAGLAAVLLVARIGSAEPAAATSLLLNAVAAVVLGGVSLFGGRGTIVGPVIGAVLLTALVNGLTLTGVSEAYQPIAVGTVVVASAVLMRYQR